MVAERHVPGRLPGKRVDQGVLPEGPVDDPVQEREAVEVLPPGRLVAGRLVDLGFDPPVDLGWSVRLRIANVSAGAVVSRPANTSRINVPTTSVRLR